MKWKRDIQGKFTLKDDGYRQVRSLRLTDATWKAWGIAAEKAQAVKQQELTASSDPWADDEDEDFCFNGFIDLAYLEHQAKKVAVHPNKLSLLLIDFKSAMTQATKKQRERIRQTIEPIYPELLNFL